MTALRPIHILLGLTFLCLAACSSNKINEQLSRSSAARKPSSLRAWQEQADPRLEKLKDTAARTSLLLSGLDRVFIITSPTARGTLKDHVAMKTTEKAAGAFGSAVPITQDGYFLTAEHCLGTAPLSLLVFTTGDRFLKVPARVVWRAPSAPGAPDLAILHAPVRLSSAFALAKVNELKPGEPVALAGWSKPHSNSLAGGRIMEIGSLQRAIDGVAWRSIQHDAPFASGDSGGPLIASDGKLVGINSQMTFSLFTGLRILLGLDGSAKRPLSGYLCEAFQPDCDWLKRALTADRRAQRAR